MTTGCIGRHAGPRTLAALGALAAGAGSVTWATGEDLQGGAHATPSHPLVVGGFISVAGDRVSLLGEAAELVSEIDADRAQQALTRAKAGEFGPDSEAAAVRAELRLRAVGRGE